MSFVVGGKTVFCATIVLIIIHFHHLPTLSGVDILILIFAYMRRIRPSSDTSALVECNNKIRVCELLLQKTPHGL